MLLSSPLNFVFMEFKRHSNSHLNKSHKKSSYRYNKKLKISKISVTLTFKEQYVKPIPNIIKFFFTVANTDKTAVVDRYKAINSIFSNFVRELTIAQNLYRRAIGFRLSQLRAQLQLPILSKAKKKFFALYKTIARVKNVLNLSPKIIKKRTIFFWLLRLHR